MVKSSGSERPGDSRSPSKPFSFSIPFLRSKSQAEVEPKKMSVSKVKLNAELCFQDIEGTDAERLRYKIRGAREVKDLWILRSDIHQLISHKISQQEAAKRINALLPCFEHWIPAQALVKI